MKESKGVVHLPGLNGIRAMAAIAVVFSHTTLTLDEFGLNKYIFGTQPDGNPGGVELAAFGVSMFFSLSGFLITYLLLLEKEKQPIDIKNFYIRRVLRIHPLYYTYLAVALGAIFIFDLEFSARSLFFYIFLAANIPFILNTPLPLLGHYWSLGVEEQFYLFYPWLVKKSRKLGAVLVLLTIALIGLKLIARYVDFGLELLPYYVLHVTRFQCMLIGAIGAWLFYRRDALFISVATSLPAQIVSWGCILLVGMNHFHIASVLDQEIISGVTVLLILGQVTVRNRIVNLDLRFFDFLGKISYGIYVIHPLILFGLTKVFTFELPIVLKYVSVYVTVMAATIFAAYLSYEYFEKRFLVLKSRFSAVVSSPSKSGA